MGEPIVGWRDDMTLDGPLAWAAYVHQRGEQPSTPPTGDWIDDIDLPLARWSAPVPDGAHVHPRLLDDGMVWGWATSVVHTTDELALSGVWVRRKPALEAMATWSDAKRHHVGLGPLKARNVLHPAAYAPRVSWWVLGDLENVEQLISTITHLGRATRHGHGRVLRWTVEPIDDRDAWRNRPMPTTGGYMSAVRAPAWHPSRQVPCL